MKLNTNVKRKIKNCCYCNKEYINNSNNSKYCSSSCKYKGYRTGNTYKERNAIYVKSKNFKETQKKYRTSGKGQRKIKEIYTKYYPTYLIKARIYGDGNYQVGQDDRSDFTTRTNFAFIPTKEIIIYENNITVTSGSFKYNASSSEAASSSGANVTLFYQSGSNGPSGSFTGSNINQGSHIYLNVNLTTPASSGYYAEPGTHNVLHAFRGGLIKDVTGSATSGIEFQVPRFVSRSVGPF